jgi:hypothetical protein
MNKKPLHFFKKVNELRATGNYTYTSKQVAEELNRSHEEIFHYIVLHARKERELHNNDTLDLFIPQFSHEGINPDILHFDISEEGYDALVLIEMLRTVRHSIKNDLKESKS